MNSIVITVTLMFAGGVFSITLAQPVFDPEVCAKSVVRTESKWKRVELGDFSLESPDFITFRINHGVDQTSWEYRTSNTRVTIYLGRAAPKAGYFVRQLPSFVQRASDVNGVPVVLWEYYNDEEKETPFICAARYQPPELDDTITIVIRSATKEGVDFAPRLFCSVRFRSEPVRKRN